jgi:hypothetical protein
MSSRVILCRTQAGAYVSTLPPDRDIASWHNALVSEITLGLSAAHAAILAAPHTSTQGLEWVAQGDRAVPAESLSPESQQALRRALGSILGDIDDLAGTGRAPALAASWPAIRRIPDEGFMYALDGRPVLAAWGHAPTAAASWPDPLAALMPPALPPTAPAAAAPAPRPLLAAFIAAAFILGLIIPALALWPFNCALSGTALAQGQQEIALDSALANQPQGQAPLPACTRALPKDAWDAGNLSMLNGCWHLNSNLVLYLEATQKPHPLANWVICFDSQGNGEQTATFTDGTMCTGPVKASFNGQHDLVIREPEECSGASPIVIGQWRCKRMSDSEADCLRSDTGGHSEAIFKR